MENMPLYKKFFGHLYTINYHKFLVMKLCFKCGMYYQGLVHDLSKYSLQEFIPSVKYFQGNRSPISKEKEMLGYSYTWLHHKGRNKHHWEYWIDRDYITNEVTVYPMPFKYLLESCLDRIAASKVYNKDKYNDEVPYHFFVNSREVKVMNPKDVEDISKLLLYLIENGERKALEYYKSLYKQYKKDKNFTL